MSNLNLIDSRTTSKEAEKFRSGDTVRVHQRIQEGDKERVQVFEGVVIKIHRAGANSTFTVRKISYGIGVEKVFRTYSPLLEKIEIKQPGKVRRSRLYYLRGLKGKAARIKEKREL